MFRKSLLAALAAWAVSATVSGEEVLLLVEDAAPDGLALAAVDLSSAAARAPLGDPSRLRAFAIEGEERETPQQPLPFQFVPGPDSDNPLAGTVLLRLPAGYQGMVRLVPGEDVQRGEPTAWDGSVSTPFYTIEHKPEHMGRMPSTITFAATGRTFEGFRFQDRLYNPGAGSFTLAGDPQAEAEPVSDGPLATVVRTRARYVQGDKFPTSKPRTVYDWYYLRDRPLVFVQGQTEQASAHAWKEVHFLELNYPKELMPHWIGGEPVERGDFAGSRESYRFPEFAAVHDGINAIAMMRCGQVLLYDGGPGTYLQARGDEAWQGFDTLGRKTSAWLWLGPVKEVVEAVGTAAHALPTEARITATVDRVHQAVAEARRQISALPVAERQQAWWRASGAERLEFAGRFDDSLTVAAGKRPEAWTVLGAGDLGLIVERIEGGFRLLDLFDGIKGRHLLTADSLPLFSFTLCHLKSKELLRLEADQGWKACHTANNENGGVTFHWKAAEDERLNGLQVVARATPRAADHTVGWQLSVDGVPEGWTLWEVTFPQLPVARLGTGAKVFVPHGCGKVEDDAWDRSFRFGGRYPSGWTSMQFAAAYEPAGRTGLYVGSHDPWAATKNILVESQPSDSRVVFSVTHPAPGMGTSGNRFDLDGEVVWRLLRGDWFDASMVYRRWVRREARWYPKLGPEGRSDTPLWMRRLPAWGLGGGEPSDVLPRVKRFAEYLGVPAGFHWYRWHQIPFDNDYPHYFPTRDGFPEAVAALQGTDVHVMPYINGRLWDTRDRGMEDYRFSQVALPAATKDADGQPYVEMYSSKESDKSRVRLAAMCPATDLWQDKVREIVLRLFNECGVQAVYIDQVAAAKPQLCFDPSHGHPLGGGHWWTESYWKMMRRIRDAMPKDRVLTTECNAEPYVHVFDGYLTWHWQYDGQVPAFPAVYGGAIQMFGRAYRGGPSKNLAFRMKAGQQLVFGEQIGWCHPGVVDERDNAEFLRQVVRLRSSLARYFYAGEMARPPRLKGPLPRVTADWQWHGHWPVTTDAVMAGAWQLPREKRLLLLFVNVGDDPVPTALEFDASQYALPDGPLRATRVTPDGPAAGFSLSRKTQRDLELPPRTAWAWEVAAERP